MLQEWKWIQPLYLLCHIPKPKRLETMVFNRLHCSLPTWLKPPTTVTEKELQWCFNYKGPSINHAPCGWQLNPSPDPHRLSSPFTVHGLSTAAVVPEHSRTRLHMDPLQSPAATDRAADAGKSHGRQQKRQKRVFFSFFSVCVHSCASCTASISFNSWTGLLWI